MSDDDPFRPGNRARQDALNSVASLKLVTCAGRVATWDMASSGSHT